MGDIQNSFISKSFLRSVWAHEYETFKDSPQEVELLERLKRWAARGVQKETTAQSALMQEFFSATWGYVQAVPKLQAVSHSTVKCGWVQRFGAIELFRLSAH